MKRIDRLILTSFIGPFVLTFFITLFVLVMQFLWKYIDDLVGKGLEWYVLAELMFYASARLVPLALPLAVLLSSIMTFGALGENYELTAMKSSGISLLRAMRPLVITTVGVSVFAFFFSNNLLPYANLKFGALLYDIRHQKPTLNFKEGVFNTHIEGFSLRAGSKDENGKTLYDIMIYDHTSGKGNDHVIIAEKAVMYDSDDQSEMIMKLYNGKQYKEIHAKSPKEETYEHYTTTFDEWEKHFDMSQFSFERTDEKFFKDLHQMLTLVQLNREMDTIAMEMEQKVKVLGGNLKPYMHRERYSEDTTAVDSNVLKIVNDVFPSVINAFEALPVTKRKEIYANAMNKARNIKSYAGVAKRELSYRKDKMVDHKIEWHRKFTLSIACLVLFFIGAPLGSIIRKGGLGWPLFWSIIFFIVFHISSITGEKMAEEMVIEPRYGMWMATVLLSPLGIFLTIKAKNDSALYNRETYIRYIKFIARIFGNRKASDS